MNPSIADKILELKTKRDAVILAHNYTRPEVQDIADFTGDSLELSRKAASATNKVIVFCGVKFMAETAKILSPSRTVLMPDLQAGCPMADMITDDEVRELKAKHPGACVVCYVNSSAAVKAETDICCTSSNAVKVVNSIPKDRDIIFIPDKYLGQFVESKTNRKLILFDGFCPTHQRVTPQKIFKAKQLYPDAKVIVHPECTQEAIHVADEALSTGQMIKYVNTAPAGTYLIGTENGMIYPLSKLGNNKKIVHIADDILCPNMKLNTLEKTLWSLEDMEYEITLDPDVIEKAKISLEAMLKI